MLTIFYQAQSTKLALLHALLAAPLFPTLPRAVALARLVIRHLRAYSETASCYQDLDYDDLKRC